jgi:hypothetical protein
MVHTDSTFAETLHAQINLCIAFYYQPRINFDDEHRRYTTIARFNEHNPIGAHEKASPVIIVIARMFTYASE